MAKVPTTKFVNRRSQARLTRQRQQTRYILIGAIAVAVLTLSVIIFGILNETVIKENRVVAKAAGTNISYKQMAAMTRFNRFLQIRNVESYLGNSFMLQFYASTIQQMVASLQNSTGFAQDTLDGLINDAFILREAEARGITASTEEIEAEMQQAFGFYAAGTPTPLPTDAIVPTATLNPTQETWLQPTATIPPTFTPDPLTPTFAPTATVTPGPSATPQPSPTLAQTYTPEPSATPYTIEGYETTYGDFLTSIKPLGLNEAFMREYIRRTILRRMLADDLTKDLPNEADFFWARHILVPTEEEALAVLEKLNQGGDWNALAAENSTDESNKNQGGDLGWFTADRMVKEFSAATAALQIGQISQPVQTEFGYHIIQLLGREVRPLLTQEIDQRKSTELTKFLDEQKAAEPPETFDFWKGDMVPAEPEVPAEVLNTLAQYNEAMQQQMPSPLDPGQ